VDLILHVTGNKQEAVSGVMGSVGTKRLTQVRKAVHLWGSIQALLQNAQIEQEDANTRLGERREPGLKSVKGCIGVRVSERLNCGRHAGLAEGRERAIAGGEPSDVAQPGIHELLEAGNIACGFRPSVEHRISRIECSGDMRYELYGPGVDTVVSEELDRNEIVRPKAPARRDKCVNLIACAQVVGTGIGRGP